MQKPLEILRCEVSFCFGRWAGEPGRRSGLSVTTIEREIRDPSPRATTRSSGRVTPLLLLAAEFEDRLAEGPADFAHGLCAAQVVVGVVAADLVPLLEV